MQGHTGSNSCFPTDACAVSYGNLWLPVLWIRIRMDPHHFGNLDRDLDPHQGSKPDPHQIKIRIRIRIKEKCGSGSA
jgi:hypothetical protein